MQRYICRAPGNRGSIILYDFFGETKGIEVKDSIFRSFLSWGHNSKEFCDDFRVPFFINTAHPTKAAPINRINGVPMPAEMPDDVLCKRLKTLANLKSATEYSEIITAETRETYADGWCKKFGYVLPNLYQSLVIYLMADYIDLFDITLPLHENRALGYKKFKRKQCCGFWTCNFYGDKKAVCITEFGEICAKNRTHSMLTVPIRELKPEEIPEIPSDFKLDPIKPDPSFAREIPRKPVKRWDNYCDPSFYLDDTEEFWRF